jgi:Sigma-70 region 2
MTEEEFDQLRPSAFAIANRMLGSVSEADDVVQEGFLRLHRARAGGERERRSEAVVRGETLPMWGGAASVLERTRARRWLRTRSPRGTRPGFRPGSRARGRRVGAWPPSAPG